MDDHYIAWRQSHDSPGTEYIDGEGPFSFCSYPFLLNPRAKSKLLHTEAKFMMNHTVQQVRSPVQQPNGCAVRTLVYSMIRQSVAFAGAVLDCCFCLCTPWSSSQAYAQPCKRATQAGRVGRCRCIS